MRGETTDSVANPTYHQPLRLFRSERHPTSFQKTVCLSSLIATGANRAFDCWVLFVYEGLRHALRRHKASYILAESGDNWVLSVTD